jgi:hypothetical protein
MNPRNHPNRRKYLNEKVIKKNVKIEQMYLTRHEQTA